MRFRDQVVIVTGAGRGIGKATATAFAAEGAATVLAELDPSSAEKVGERIRADGGRALPVATDVTDTRSVEAMVQRVLDELGGIDVLVNNVGGGTGPNGPDIGDQDWERGLQLNLTTTFTCCRAVVPHMTAQRRGKIVNISSNAGRYMSRYFASLAYVAAKGGVSALTRQLAWLLGSDGINVNAIEPGHVWTELTQEQWPTFAPELRQQIVREIPLARMCEPAEIAQAVLFLASSDADFMTGATLEVNGGLWMS
ncbi:MAG TPA: SDR family NAD(P)-dependent oxidoreductase [Actinomycetes bacterium]|nr:SDR family NAD(P)-dependent oxidoreductase [Actinomycetes bacterium]